MDHAESPDAYSQAVADFVAGLSPDAVPEAVRERLKLLILDALGCGLYGAGLPWSRILRDTLASVDDGGGATVWGTEGRLSAPHAALVNGSQVQGFELDDVHRGGVLHVGAVVLPALLAVVEAQGDLSGRDFLTAALAGYEVGPRVGLCMGQEHIGQGWHSGATVGVFAAAAAAARGLSLDAERTLHALGIAGTQSSGLMAAQYGAMVKRMHAGRAAQSGYYGALLAANGFTGIRNVFEAPYGGFCTTFSRSTDRFDLEQLRAGLGERFETMRVTLKFYACVGSTHTTLDALKAIRQRRPFGPADMERIVVGASQVTVDHAGWPYAPEGPTSAQLNLQFCVATLLLEGDVFVDQFRPGAENDPDRLALIDRVRVEHDPAITALGSRHRHKVHVAVHFRDGTVERETREAPRVDEDTFWPAEDIVAKFRKLTRDCLSPARQDALVETVLDLERLDSARGLVRLLAA